jgi:hypothetical protein
MKREKSSTLIHVWTGQSRSMSLITARRGGNAVMTRLFDFWPLMTSMRLNSSNRLDFSHFFQIMRKYASRRSTQCFQPGRRQRQSGAIALNEPDAWSSTGHENGLDRPDFLAAPVFCDITCIKVAIDQAVCQETQVAVPGSDVLSLTWTLP